ncbi:MAG: hypothetical protein PWP45_1117 [Tepidanaerobacteraceae bacterium]|nr:hypothetical protein [Tepidanaerobacteraceae bacterium]
MVKWMKTTAIFFIILSVISSFTALIPRLKAENQNNLIDGALSYTDLKTLAQDRQTTIDAIARSFKENAGVNAILYKEETIKDLSDNGNLFVANRQQMVMFGWKENLPFNGSETYIVSADKTVMERVRRHLAAKLGELRLANLPEKDGFYAVAVNMHPSLLYGIGVGFNREDVKKLENLGFHSIFMLKDWPNVNEEGIRFAIRDIVETGENITAVLFEKKDILGYPDYLWVLAEEMNKYNLPLGEVEFYNQKGFGQLAKLVNNRVLRMHSVADEEMQNIDPNTLVDRLTLAATERNIRILFLKFLPANDVEQRLNKNVGYMKKVVSRLEKEGLYFKEKESGKPRPFEPFAINPLWFLLMGLGPVGGGMLLLEKLGVRRNLWIILVAAFAMLGAVAGFFVMPLFYRKVVALSSVIIFPVLSMLHSVPKKGFSRFKATIKMLEMTAFSLVGALIMSGVLSDTSFMLKIEQFSGVKAAYSIPVLLTVLAFFVLHGEGTLKERINKLLDHPVLVKYLLLALLFAGIGLIYITRTGNDAAVGVSAIELKFRALLDQVMGIRPRTKEFLIGHPLMFALFCWGYNDNRYLPVLALASIGQVSMVNTFAHIHTPFVVSLIRSVNGLILGIIIGYFVVFAMRVLEVFGKRWHDA